MATIQSCLWHLRSRTCRCPPKQRCHASRKNHYYPKDDQIQKGRFHWLWHEIHEGRETWQPWRSPQLHGEGCCPLESRTAPSHSQGKAPAQGTLRMDQPSLPKQQEAETKRCKDKELQLSLWCKVLRTTDIYRASRSARIKDRPPKQSIDTSCCMSCFTSLGSITAESWNMQNNRTPSTALYSGHWLKPARTVYSIT